MESSGRWSPCCWWAGLQNEVLHRVLEKNLQRSCIRYATSLGALCVKLSALGRYGNAGFPDYLIILPNGRVLFVEFKAPNGALTKLQEHWQAKLRAAHQQVHTVDSGGDFRLILTVAMGAAPTCPKKDRRRSARLPRTSPRR
jgi:VRR-NUC domain